MPGPLLQVHIRIAFGQNSPTTVAPSDYSFRSQPPYSLAVEVLRDVSSLHTTTRVRTGTVHLTCGPPSYIPLAHDSHLSSLAPT